jgi:hypothetical protein
MHTSVALIDFEIIEWYVGVYNQLIQISLKYTLLFNMDPKNDPKVDAGSDDEMAAAEKSGKPLSQAQKKKLKAKQKAEEEKKLAAEG